MYVGISPLLGNLEMCKLLIDAGAALSSIMRNYKGNLMTPLDVASQRGNKGCAKYIQLRGGMPADKITSGTALQKALSR